jgi:hypothetical protein
VFFGNDKSKGERNLTLIISDEFELPGGGQRVILKGRLIPIEKDVLPTTVP